ncbi:MAG: hypothetical protein JXQ93_01010 [Flavobacteriaceae bacterium]
MKSILFILYKNSNMEEHVKKSWFKRNWMWFVPVSGCLTLIILFFLGIGALIFGVTNMISNSTPAEYAFEQATKNKQVTLLLGDSIEQKGITSGSINLSNSNGDADLIIPIRGSRGKGTIRVVATKVDGDWVYEKLYVIIKETNENINLIDKSLEGV